MVRKNKSLSLHFKKGRTATGSLQALKQDKLINISTRERGKRGKTKEKTTEGERMTSNIWKEQLVIYIAHFSARNATRIETRGFSFYFSLPRFSPDGIFPSHPFLLSRESPKRNHSLLYTRQKKHYR